MQKTKFDELYEKLEQDLSFASDDAFMRELRASIQTPEHWARLARLYCTAADKLINFIMDTPIPIDK